MPSTQADQIAIRPIARPINAEIAVPGSKSITNRALLLTALADGVSTLENALFSEDSHWFVDCLHKTGITVENGLKPPRRLRWMGRAGASRRPKPIYLWAIPAQQRGS